MLPGSVLFACSHNSIRSPIAEGLLKHLHGKRIFVDSVGLKLLAVNDFAIAAMAEIGIDISRHKAKSFAELRDTSFDLIVTFSPEAHHAALELTRIMACDVEYWPVMDPSITEGNRETVLAGFRDTRDRIKSRILTRFPLPGASP